MNLNLLLGIPDLPLMAFTHCGDKKIKPEGGKGGGGDNSALLYQLNSQNQKIRDLEAASAASAQTQVQQAVSPNVTAQSTTGTDPTVEGTNVSNSVDPNKKGKSSLTIDLNPAVKATNVKRASALSTDAATGLSTTI